MMNGLVRRTIAAIALCLPVAAATAGTFADLSIVNRTTGQRLPVYSHGGKLYVAGQPGDRYAVQVTNRTGQRVMTVVSVDGVNVVSGETAQSNQTGYVLSPWQSYDILGWRTTSDEVAAFYFTALPDSYAARTDRPQNVGVIGVAVFREWTPPRPRPHPQPRPFEGVPGPSQDSSKAERAAPAEAQSNASSMMAERDQAGRAEERAAPSTPAMRRQAEKLGTGHGEREGSSVSYTDFRRASPSPNKVLTIYYDRYENLVARGIVPGTTRYAEPIPFPAGVRFVPDPRG
jgi:hypothetical protein